MTENPNEQFSDSTRLGVHPNLLLRSFFVVVGCYLIYVVLFIAVGLCLALLLEGSAFIEKMQTENLARSGEDFETLFSKTWSWIMLGVGAILAFGVGFLVCRMAEFSRFGHGVMLAVLFFVTLVNTFFNQEDAAPFFFRLTMLGFVPIGVLFGAKYCEIRQLESLYSEESDTAESETEES